MLCLLCLFEREIETCVFTLSLCDLNLLKFVGWSSLRKNHAICQHPFGYVTLLFDRTHGRLSFLLPLLLVSKTSNQVSHHFWNTNTKAHGAVRSWTPPAADGALEG